MFFKKKHTPLNLSWLKTDMHAHLLPGIDDGAPDISTSMELIRGLQQLGYQKLIATPHILPGLYPNTPDIIASKAEEVRQQIASEGINIEFQAAAEYFIDEEFTGALKSRKPLLTISGNLVLVEFSMLTSPIDLQEVLAAIDDVARSTGENRSSMLVDLESGTQTEIDAINGAIISEARRHSIRVPANQLMTALVRAREGRFDDTSDRDSALDAAAIA